MKLRPHPNGFSSMRSGKFFNKKITILSGGVGGAKLVLGMAHCLLPSRLNVIVNTADDAVFHGLHVSPDLDTTMYTLAGMVNPRTGWGIDRDTFSALSLLRRYGEESWFHLGDRDLGTHILRTKLLREGQNLTQVTSLLARKLNVRVRILPMTDAKVETLIRLRGKWIPFQDYFVRKRAKGKVTDIRFKGIRNTTSTKQVIEALGKADLIVIAPSNPVVSILPILSLPGFKELLKKTKAFKLAISPFIGNRAISGPAKELMEAIGFEGSSLGLAKFYSGLIDLLVIDKRDIDKVEAIQALGMDVLMTKTVMKNLMDKIKIARMILNINQAR
jgi:LPPG:FO 2-phospho-L-lactate transferase